MKQSIELTVLDAMEQLPGEIEDYMIWPVQYCNDGGKWEITIFMLAHSDRWYIWEYWPNAWGIITSVPNKQKGIEWVRYWMHEYVPDLAKLYFPKQVLQ